MKGFKKCCISNGTVDDMLWSGGEEGGNGRRECGELTVKMGSGTD